MHCKYCGFANGEDDHRCLRCGRRIGIAFAAPTALAGANALAPAYDLNDTQDVAPAQTATAEGGKQHPLFTMSGQKVIPFDQLQRHVTGKITVREAPPAAPRVTVRRTSGPVAQQGSLDFVPASLPQRTLKNDVPAQIYCEQPVATLKHRFIASCMDTSMILLAFGVFVMAGELTGGNFGSGKLFWSTMGAAFGLISMFYGLIWVLAGRETAGMAWTDLQLITFDGFPVDARSRAARFASTWLSFCSGGLGLVWAVADEENLTWHDHISKTFPTIREAPVSFVRQRR